MKDSTLLIISYLVYLLGKKLENLEDRQQMKMENLKNGGLNFDDFQYFKNESLANFNPLLQELIVDFEKEIDNVQYFFDNKFSWNRFL